MAEREVASALWGPLCDVTVLRSVEMGCRLLYAMRGTEMGWHTKGGTKMVGCAMSRPEIGCVVLR